MFLHFLSFFFPKSEAAAQRLPDRDFVGSNSTKRAACGFPTHRHAVVGHAVSGARDGRRSGRLRPPSHPHRADFSTEQRLKRESGKEEEEKAKEERKRLAELRSLFAVPLERRSVAQQARVEALVKSSAVSRRKRKKRKKKLPKSSSACAFRTWIPRHSSTRPLNLPVLRPVSACCLRSTARYLVRQ